MNMVLWYSLVGMRDVMQSAGRPWQHDTAVLLRPSWGVSGRMWYGDDSPHPTTLEPA